MTSGSDGSARAITAAERLGLAFAVSGTISIGGGAHGVGITVEAEALVEALGATTADVTEPG
jgi:hypothetical protein